ncbi:hypothetical protein DFQ28_004339 [Apophysomyces sp. BC1034]|nr:hypothetical protein DFQ30_004431 [Apophysomyces sp. BC1015]KAG0178379.1 hypothetical protein DFQ29_003525 [Apophysomyces sp. BC1021]KAG0188800.1 hypothetical protein DFQ28_004339 [Apophysomyces sp. BC1034]
MAITGWLLAHRNQSSVMTFVNVYLQVLDSSDYGRDTDIAMRIILCTQIRIMWNRPGIIKFCGIDGSPDRSAVVTPLVCWVTIRVADGFFRKVLEDISWYIDRSPCMMLVDSVIHMKLGL